MEVIISKIDGNLTAEELRIIGEMIEQGYTESIDRPCGIYWAVKIDD